MSIRLRLTLLYTAILGVTLVVFALFVYTLLTRNLLQGLDGSLVDTANAAVRIPRILSGPGSDAEREAIGRVLAERNGGLPASGRPPTSDIYLQYVDGNGGVAARSPALTSLGLTLPVPQGPPARRIFRTVRVSGQDFRVLLQPLPALRPGGGFFEIARSLAEVEQTQAHLRVVLAFGGIGALLLAGVTGWGLATLALRPIDQLTQAAQEIGEAQDFTRRVPYEGPGDEVGRLAGTFNEMLGRLQAAYARIQRALEAQRRFVADASHELRTPLTTIRGNVELLEMVEANEPVERQEALHDIASEAERMSRLVTDLLALARADAGLHIQRVYVPMLPLVDEIGRQLRRTAGDVRIEIGPMPDVVVSGSADHLKQLLLILLDNARKYSPPNGVVRLNGEQSDGWLKVSVSDEGPGIPPRDQERIFDRFYRIDASRHGEGAGLGLAIARWIATEHDASLSVESSPGKGSVFTLSIPLAQPAPAPPAPAGAVSGSAGLRPVPADGPVD